MCVDCADSKEGAVEETELVLEFSNRKDWLFVSARPSDTWLGYKFSSRGFWPGLFSHLARLKICSGDDLWSVDDSTVWPPSAMAGEADLRLRFETGEPALFSSNDMSMVALSTPYVERSAVTGGDMFAIKD